MKRISPSGLGEADWSLCRKVADTIRVLSAECVQKANSGHPGLPLGAADFAATLWARHLVFDPAKPGWPGRDRFVLSAGHGSALLYCLLHLFGYDLSLEDLADFRQWESKTPGHPERGHTPGVEVTTGPLGQGLANGVGFALAAKMASARFATPDFDPYDLRVYVLAGDGCMMEGISNEAASLAGHLALNNLIVIYDKNDISIEGSTDLAFTERVDERFAALGWHVQSVDGHNVEAVDKALTQAKTVDQPALILARTRIARGAPSMEGSHESHGAPLGAAEIAGLKKALQWPEDEFHIPKEVQELRGAMREAGAETHAAWHKKLAAWAQADPERAKAHKAFLDRRRPDLPLKDFLDQAPSKDDATRGHGAAALQILAKHFPTLVGGSADLGPSNKTVIQNAGALRPSDFSGRNIHFGVREHAMGAVANGMAAFGGWRPFVATFLVFSDYMRTAIRLAAMMKLPVIHVFTHDSFQVGEDGPTHQPVEHIESLRAIPGLRVLRPADASETMAAWYSALHSDGPTALILSRQKLNNLPRQRPYQAMDLLAGAQVIQSGLNEVATLAATGSEVSLAVQAAAILKEKGVAVRVVSLLNREKFLGRPEEERHRLVPYGQPVCSLEAGVTFGWALLTGRRGLRIGLDHFGASAPAADLVDHYGFRPEAVASRIMDWLRKLNKLGRLSAEVRD